MKKKSSFNILFRYLKKEKFKLFLYIFLTILTYFPTFITPYFWGITLENLVLKDMHGFILYLAIWVGIFLFAFSFLTIPRDSLYNDLEISFMKRVSRDIYRKINQLPAIAFEDMGVGEFVNRLYSDPERVMELLKKLVTLICKSAAILFVFVFSFYVSILLGIEVLIFGLFMGFISSKFFPKIQKTQEIVKEESDKYVKVATENLSGIREIKALGIRSLLEKNMSDICDNLFLNSRKIKQHEVVYYSFNNLAYFVLEFIILLTAGYYVLQGKIAFSVFATLESCIWRIDDVVESLADFGVDYNKVKVSLKRIGEIVDNQLYQDEAFGNRKLKNPKGVIEFKNVNFHYREGEENALNGLTMKLEPNKKIAIVGKSGNGKSTIFNLLLRYFDASEGKITIDGVDLTELSEEALRENISIIRQAPFLFNLSIMDNFKLVKPDVTLEEVRDVCQKAYIDSYIMSLKDQYDTIIGEGGVNLSGGQKQRIAIARTLLRNTKVILFDEATSALDNESQAYIKKTIDSLVKDHTVIIVAHRLSTIVDADKIYIIDQGKLVDQGTHAFLLKNNSLYQSLYKTES